jgi:choline dehydrogenase-like flavoprotein
MPFADASHVEPGSDIDADVCVAGGGPAGLAIALELAAAGLRVSLVESGGFHIEPATAELNELDNAGLPLRAPYPLRDRRFGGTFWYGRCVRLDALDFERRSWVSGSGWPLAPSELESHYSRALSFLGIPRPEALAPGFWRREPALHALSGGGVTARVHLITRKKDLGQRYRAAAESLPRLNVLLHATVAGIETGADSGAVTALRVRGPQGQEFRCTARRYVLACGGLENARLLLLLAAEQPGALGACCSVLGRFYMNHPRSEGVARLHLDPAHPNFNRLFRRLTERRCRASGSRMQLAAGLDEATQRREELLNACGFFYICSEARLRELRPIVDQLTRSAAKRKLAPGDAQRAGQLVRNFPLLAGAAVARLRQRPFLVDHLIMVEQLEQSPDKDSRVTLSDRRDRFGRPMARLEWRVGSDTVRTQRRFHQLLAERLRQLRIGRLESALLDDPELEPLYEDSAHPMGATRMASDPRHGVVDTDSRVHSIENLYVAGSSVFPTGGHANPTLPLVALALRLADHLRERFS